MDSKIAVLPGQSGRITQSARIAATLFFAGLMMPAFMFASGLNGTLVLNLSGSGTIAVNGSDIDFDYIGGETATFPPTATGSVDGTGDSSAFMVGGSTSSFAAIVGSMVTVHDLNVTSEPTGSIVGPGLPLTTFITFAARPTWNITLTEILAGTDGSDGSPNCSNPAGMHCTPVGSPFNLDNLGGGQVNAGFAFLGTASDGMGNTSQVAGTFSTTFSNTNYQQIVADLILGESVVSGATATIGVSSIPEPKSVSLLLLGIGLFAISAIYRRRHQRR
jgi:hypothetical protein